MSDDADQYRLPGTVVPSHYQLVLEPDLEAATFRGTEAVEVEVLTRTSEIVLNALELDLSEAWLEPADGDRIETTVTYDTATERAALTLDRAVDAGRYTLHVTFTGVLNDKLVGFYRSTFTADDGTSHTIATTQFEATHARQAFPCWDEPAWKATFGVTLVVPEGLLAVSNAAEVSSEATAGGRRTVRFADTMEMSTYLVAFVVGPLEVTETVGAGRAGGTPMRVVHPPGRSHLTAFALDVGTKALAFFEDYYGIDYPGDKLDLVAIPDFAFGAMENLGCVTFREVALLVDPDTADQPELERVADVINHELAHMWFGDLVTMRWWNGIWLNEAFATFMELLATDAYRPDWDRWTGFGTSRTAAFDTDSLEATRPIEFPVVSPAEAEGMFDVLTYEKGAAVLRMLEQFLGAEEFRSGIGRYLDTHRFANTETTDLWDAIEAATDQPARRIMDTWIFQPGYPMITAALDGDGTTVHLSQRRFSFHPDDQIDPDGEAGPGEAQPTRTTETLHSRQAEQHDQIDPDGEAGPGGAQPTRTTETLHSRQAEQHDQIDPDGEAGPGEAQPSGAQQAWAVPVLVRVESGDGAARLEKVLLDGAGATVSVPSDRATVVVNAGGHGFYRTRYDAGLLANLTGRLSSLTALERYGLLDDTWASTLAGTTGVGTLLDLLRAVASEPETDLSVWQRIIGVLGSLDRLVDGDGEARLQATVRNLSGPAQRRLGADPVDGESDRVTALRAELFGALGTLGDDVQVRERAARLHDLDVDGSGEPTGPTSLVNASVEVLARHGDAALFDRFLARSEAATSPQDRLRYLYALAAFDDPDQTGRLLDLALTPTIRSQDAAFVLRRAITNRRNGPQAWVFVTEHWDELRERVPSNSVARLLEGIRVFNQPDLARSAAAFVEAHPLPQGAKQVAQHVERMWVSVAFRQRVAADLVAALDEP